MGKKSALIAGFVFSLTASQAQASPTYFTVLELDFPSSSQTSGDISTPVSSLSLTSGGNTVSVSNTYSYPYLSVGATVGGGVSGTAETELDYSIRFNGAPGLVNVHVQAYGDVSAPIGGGAANANLTVSGTSTVIQLIACNACIFGGSSWAINGDYTFDANTTYQVSMQAFLFGIQGGSATAVVDPMYSAPRLHN